MKRTIALAGVLILTAWIPPTSVGNDARQAEAPSVVEIRLVDKGSAQWRFEPASVQVHVGDIVRFVQDDVAPHNVQFKDVPSGAKLGPLVVMGPFLIQMGSTYEIEVDDRFAPGLYKYVCTPHEPLGMKGEIEVLPAALTH